MFAYSFAALAGGQSGPPHGQLLIPQPAASLMSFSDSEPLYSHPNCLRSRYQKTKDNPFAPGLLK